MNQIENQTLALAGMFQTATLVDQLALHGQCEPDEFNCSIDSLFTIEAESTRDALGDINCLTRGFKALVDYLGGENRAPGRNVAYYMLSQLKLAAQVLNDEGLADSLLQGLQGIERDRDEFGLSPASVINKIDGLYQKCISPLSPRVIVRGEQNYLRNSDNAARVRALLLAGIRAAVLWQQLGGNRWSLFWSRRKYVASARKFLSYN